MTTFSGRLDGTGLRVALVCSRFNDLVVERLESGARDVLVRHGVADDAIDTMWVPGAWEIPMAAKAMAGTGRYDAVVGLGAVIRGVFGVETGSDGLTIAPFVTPTTHTAWLSEEDEVTLHDLTWRGRRFDVILHLPTPGSSSDRAYEVDKLQVDGADHTGPIGEEDLASGSQIDVWLTNPERRSVPTLTLVEDDGEFRRFWPPKDPGAPSVTRAGAGVQVTWPTTSESGHTWSVWRDGVRIADSLTAASWTDASANPDGRSACYAITATWTSTGLESMPSPSTCWRRWRWCGWPPCCSSGSASPTTAPPAPPRRSRCGS